MAKKLGTETKTADKADTVYSESVEKLRELETKCFQTEVPSIISEMEDIEKQRIECVKSSLESYVNLERGFPPLLTEACEKINQLVSSINSSSDLQLFSDQKKTGKQRPPLSTYEPYNESLGKCVPKEDNSSSSYTTPISSSSTRSNSQSFETTQQITSPPSQSSTPTSTSSSSSSYIGKVRALFDYDAQSEHELSFKQGEIINIVEKDTSGWWNGELNGQFGLFPAEEWVEEITGDVPTNNISGRSCRVIYSYEAQDQDEISITEGEILTITSEVF